MPPVDEEHPVVKGLRWILSNRLKPDGKKMSMTFLSSRAGLAQGHAEQILNGRQSANIDSSTAMAFARAGNVKVSWLLTHEGQREPFEEGDVEASRTIVYDDQYPLRDDAARAARALKTISEEAIEQVRSIRYHSAEGAREITADEWLDKMREAERDIRRGLLPSRALVRELAGDDLDVEPPVNRALDGRGKRGAGKKK